MRERRDSSWLERDKCEVGPRRIRHRHTMFHDPGCGLRLRFCGADTAAEANGRPVPGCLGFNCKEKRQQTKTEGKRCAPAEQGSGEQSRHNDILSRGAIEKLLKHSGSNLDLDRRQRQERVVNQATVYATHHAFGLLGCERDWACNHHMEFA